MLPQGSPTVGGLLASVFVWTDMLLVCMCVCSGAGTKVITALGNGDREPEM